MAPFRYCPVKGCGRSETPACGLDGCKVTEEHEHLGDGGYRLTLRCGAAVAVSERYLGALKSAM